MTMTKQDYYDGRKVVKAMAKVAKADAQRLVEGDPSAVDYADAVSLMETIFTMKTSNIDSLIIKKSGIFSWTVLLSLKGMPRGVPNLLGAPGNMKNKADAEAAAAVLLRAAYVKCANTTQMKRDGEMDDLRVFRLQGVQLHVPGEMVDAAAKKIPTNIDPKQAMELRQSNIDIIRTSIGPVGLNLARWSNMSEDDQIKVMISAASLLCLSINMVA